MRSGYHVYILTNKNNAVLYIGCTGFLEGRIFQHRKLLIDGFTRKYQVTKLIYYETFGTEEEASAREKQLKGWRRSKKVALIEKMNPHWLDLFLPMMEKPGFNSLLPPSGEADERSRDPSTPLRIKIYVAH
jgi:putative endonuclease